MQEELGDVLLQVLFHSVIAEERGAFGFRDVAEALITKMRGRHPHLYGDGAKEPWETMKSKKRTSLAEGLPAALPSLHRAQRLQDRAAGVRIRLADGTGRRQGAPKSSTRRAQQLRARLMQAGRPHDERTDGRELGDLLFACVNLCSQSGRARSFALDRANAKVPAALSKRLNARAESADCSRRTALASPHSTR